MSFGDSPENNKLFTDCGDGFSVSVLVCRHHNVLFAELTSLSPETQSHPLSIMSLLWCALVEEL